MALGNEIVLSVPRRGVTVEGIIEGTPKPGTIMEIKPATAKVNGRYTFRVYQPGTDGERRPIFVLEHDPKQGRALTEAYVSGDRAELYCPAMGEELNVLKGDESGTADDIAIGSLFIVDSGTGKLLLTTGTVESEPFMALEAVTDPTADQLVHCVYTGN